MRRPVRIALATPLLALAFVVASGGYALAAPSSLRPTVPQDASSASALAAALVDSTSGTSSTAASDIAALTSQIEALRAQDVSLRAQLAALSPAAAGRDAYLGRLERDAIVATADGPKDVSALSVNEQLGAADVIAEIADERGALQLRDAAIPPLTTLLSDAASHMRSDVATLEAARSAALAIESAPDADPAAALARIDALTAQMSAARVALAADSAVNVGVTLTPIASWVWPVAGDISQGFGPTSVYLEAPRIYRGIAFPYFHDAIDISAPLGSPVVAAAAGTVTFVGHFSDGAMVVQIAGPDGLQETYAHLDDLASPPPVKVGEVVAAGQRIGTIGMTGMTTGPHVHFAVYRGTTPIDPLPLLPPRG